MKKKLILSVPDVLKQKLDYKRGEGYTINGYVNSMLERMLINTPTDRRKGRRAAR